MAFYDGKEQLYLETDASCVGLWTHLLQVRDRMGCPRNEVHDNTASQAIAFTSKILTSAEIYYTKIEREALGMLHGLEKFHHNCFTGEVSIITDHKPLVALLKKGLANLSHRFQRIILWIHKYSIKILYQPGTQISWIGYPDTMLKQNRDEEIPGMCITINVIGSFTDIPDFMREE